MEMERYGSVTGALRPKLSMAFLKKVSKNRKFSNPLFMVKASTRLNLNYFCDIISKKHLIYFWCGCRVGSGRASPGCVMQGWVGPCQAVSGRVCGVGSGSRRVVSGRVVSGLVGSCWVGWQSYNKTVNFSSPTHIPILIQRESACFGEKSPPSQKCPKIGHFRCCEGGKKRTRKSHSTNAPVIVVFPH